MAIKRLTPWTLITAPQSQTDSLSIPASTEGDQRLLLIQRWNGALSYEGGDIGGQSRTGFIEFSGGGIDYWNEAAIAAMTDTDVTSVAGEEASYAYCVVDGVDQTAPIFDSVNEVNGPTSTSITFTGASSGHMAIAMVFNAGSTVALGSWSDLGSYGTGTAHVNSTHLGDRIAIGDSLNTNVAGDTFPNTAPAGDTYTVNYGSGGTEIVIMAVIADGLVTGGDYASTTAAASTVAGSIDVTRPLISTTTSSATASGYLSGPVRFVSATSVTSTVTGNHDPTRILVASTAVTSVLGPTPSLDRNPGFIAATASTSTVTSSFNKVVSFVASTNAVSSVTSTLVRQADFNSQTNSTSTVVADVRNTSIRYEATVAATSTVTGNIDETLRLLASTAVTSVLGPTPQLAVTRNIVSTTNVVSTVTPLLVGIQRVATSIAATSTVTVGDFQRSVEFSTAIAATSTVTASVKNITPQFAATVAATSTVSASLSTGKPFIAAKTTGQSPGAQNQYTVPLPTHRAGQMLVVFCGFGDTVSPGWDTVGSTAGWRCERGGGNIGNTDVGGAWFYKIADSSSEVLVAESFSSEKFHTIAYAIDDANGYFIRSDNNGFASTTQNPTFRDITLNKARDVLSFAVVYGEADSIMTSAPTGYTIDETLQGGTSFDDGSVSVAIKEANVSSEAPSTATMTNNAAHTTHTFIVYKRADTETDFEYRTRFNDSTSYFDTQNDDPRIIDNNWKAFDANNNPDNTAWTTTSGGPSGSDLYDDAFWTMRQGTGSGPEDGFVEYETTWEELGLPATTSIVGYDTAELWYQVTGITDQSVRPGTSTNGAFEIVDPNGTTVLLAAPTAHTSSTGWLQLTNSAISAFSSTPYLATETIKLRIYGERFGGSAGFVQLRFEDLRFGISTIDNYVPLAATIAATSTVTPALAKDGPEIRDISCRDFSNSSTFTLPTHQAGDLILVFVAHGGTSAKVDAEVGSSAGWERYEHHGRDNAFAFGTPQTTILYNWADSSSETLSLDLTNTASGGAVCAYSIANVDDFDFRPSTGPANADWDRALTGLRIAYATTQFVVTSVDSGYTQLSTGDPTSEGVNWGIGTASKYLNTSVDTPPTFSAAGGPFDDTIGRGFIVCYRRTNADRFRRVQWEFASTDYTINGANLDGWTWVPDSSTTAVTTLGNSSNQINETRSGVNPRSETGEVYNELGYFEIELDPIADLGLTANDRITTYTNASIDYYLGYYGGPPNEGRISKGGNPSTGVEVIDTSSRVLLPGFFDTDLAWHRGTGTDITGLLTLPTQTITLRLHVEIINRQLVSSPAEVRFDRLRFDVEFTTEIPYQTTVGATSTVAASLEVDRPIQSTLNVTSTVNGNIDPTRKLITAVIAQSVLGPTPSLEVDRPLISTTTAATLVSPNLGLTVFLAADPINAVSTVNPNQFYYGFESSISATSTVTADLEIVRPLMSATVSQSAVVGPTRLQRAVDWNSVTSVASTVFTQNNGILVDRPLRADFNGFSVTVAIMDIKGKFVAQVAGTSTVTATIERERRLQTPIVATTVVNGNIVEGLRFLTGVIAQSVLGPNPNLAVARDMIAPIVVVSTVDQSLLQRSIEFDTTINVISTVTPTVVVITNTLELTWSETYFYEPEAYVLRLKTDTFDDTVIVNEIVDPIQRSDGDVLPAMIIDSDDDGPA